MVVGSNLKALDHFELHGNQAAAFDAGDVPHASIGSFKKDNPSYL